MKAPQLVTEQTAVADFKRAFQKLCHGHQPWRVFADFCEMAALSMANSIQVPSDDWNARDVAILRWRKVMMRVRYKKTSTEANASTFNMCSMSEVITGDDSVPIGDLDVMLSNGKWKDMRAAFIDHDLIIDNYNTCFFEPENQMERERGWR